jgi:preprotein translocase subunit SecA
MSFLEKLFGSNEREVNRLRPIVATINTFDATLTSLSDEALRGKTTEFKERLAKGGDA